MLIKIHSQRNRLHGKTYYSSLILTGLFTLGSVIISFIFALNYSLFILLILIIFTILIIIIIANISLKDIKKFYVTLPPIISAHYNFNNKNLSLFLFKIPLILTLVFSFIFLVVAILNFLF
jgi:uncharacterized membrane protein